MEQIDADIIASKASHTWRFRLHVNPCRKGVHAALSLA
jgi:hypothetical protein